MEDLARKIGRILFISLLLFIATFGNPIHSYAQSPILIDHNCAKLADIPSEWITAAKQNLHIAYGCSSHGSQLTTGMTGLVTWKGALYGYNFGGTNGALDLREWSYDDGFGHPNATTYANDLGDPNRTAWAAATRQYLNAHPEINVVIWAWCYQMMTDIPADIDLYLSRMTELEQDFPSVKFVYMTGHVTAGQLWGPGTQWSHVHYMRAKQIRDYCAANNKILYDFADIESWDPDGNWYGDKLVDDACNYDSDGNGETDQNWAVNWQNAHPGEWYACESAHTAPLNANLKAYAAWWLWARLAGWTGEADIVLNSVSLDPASVPGGSPSTGTVTLSGPAPVGGTVVTLSSSDPAAQTPASVTVTAGETTGTFPVTTSPVGTDTPVTISGTHDSGTQGATLTVTATVVVPSLMVTSPNGGESWALGTAHAVTWTQTGLTGTVTVDLYKGGVWQKILGTPAATAGTFSWVIGTSEIAGTDYRVLVWQESVSDNSDANFAIVRTVKVDFNNDGQEDILWRYQAIGELQGSNVVWLMNQTEGLASIPLGISAQETESMNLPNGSALQLSRRPPLNAGKRIISKSGKSLLNPWGRGKLPVPKEGESSLYMERARDLPILSKRSAKKSPMEFDRDFANRAARLFSVPTMKDAEALSAAVDGTTGITSVSVVDCLYPSTILDLGWEIGGAGDFNGDGNTDILWRNYGAGEYSGWNCVWYMNGATIIGFGYPERVLDLDWRIEATGDFNGDGNLDILWRNYGSGTYSGWNCIWYMNGEVITGYGLGAVGIIGFGYPEIVLDVDWRIAGAGDFNGDGHADLLWRNYGSGTYSGWNCIWYMNGTMINQHYGHHQEGIIGFAYPCGISDLSWKIAGTGDFNKDGYMDILWRYYGAGGGQGWNCIWYMQGAAIIGYDYPSTIPDTNWRIVNR